MRHGAEKGGRAGVTAGGGGDMLKGMVTLTKGTDSRPASSSAVLEPDEARFSLEYSGFDPYEVDLLSADVSWQVAGKDSNQPCQPCPPGR